MVADGIRGSLQDNGVPADEIAKILNPAPVTVVTLEPQDPNRDTNSTVAFIASCSCTDSSSATACGSRPA